MTITIYRPHTINPTNRLNKRALRMNEMVRNVVAIKRIAAKNSVI